MKASDDVIRIRVDTGQAVREFLGLLAEQAAAGETRAPAKPANRAVYRELAPYRLVEYSYVDPGIGAIEAVFLGFPDGSIYSVADDIPEEVVDTLVVGDPTRLPPVYVHVVLAEPQPVERIDHFLAELARHMGKGLVGVLKDGARAYEGLEGCAAMLKAAVAQAVDEAAGLPDKAALLAAFAARSQAADGRAYAQLIYDYAPHVLEFPSPADRDDFIAWSRFLCDWVVARWATWEDLGFSDVLRPAKPAPAPTGEVVAVPLVAPARWQDGEAWVAFGGADAATAHSFQDSAAHDSETLAARSVALARAYWAYVTATVAAGEGK